MHPSTCNAFTTRSPMLTQHTYSLARACSAFRSRQTHHTYYMEPSIQCNVKPEHWALREQIWRGSTKSIDWHQKYKWDTDTLAFVTICIEWQPASTAIRGTHKAVTFAIGRLSRSCPSKETKDWQQGVCRNRRRGLRRSKLKLGSVVWHYCMSGSVRIN